MTKYEFGITLKKSAVQIVYGAITYALFVFSQVPDEKLVPSMIVGMTILRALQNYLKHRN